MSNEIQDCSDKIYGLINALDTLAHKHNLAFNYFEHATLIRFEFGNCAYYKILYKVLHEKSINEIVESIEYTLHHNYRIIRY